MAVSNHLGLYLPTREDYISVKRDLSDNFELIDASAEMVEKGVAIPVDGDTAPIALTAGEYILLKNHSSLASGGYVVQSNIAAQASITSGNVSPLGKGLTNALNSKITTVTDSINTTISANDNYNFQITNSIPSGYKALSFRLLLQSDCYGDFIISAIQTVISTNATYVQIRNASNSAQILHCIIEVLCIRNY